MDETKIDIDERIKSFLESNTYTFIMLHSGELFNGYILSVNKAGIKFKDDMLGAIPISIADIKIISYSKKGVKNDWD